MNEGRPYPRCLLLLIQRMVEPGKSRAGKICVLRVVLWKEPLVVKEKKG